MGINDEGATGSNQDPALISKEFSARRGKVGLVTGALVVAGALLASTKMANTADSLNPYPNNDRTTTSIEGTTAVTEVTTAIVEVGPPPVPTTTEQHDIGLPIFPSMPGDTLLPASR